MNAIGKAKSILDEVLTPAEIIEKINCIQPGEVSAVIKRTFLPESICAALVGSEDKRDRIWELIRGGI
jgi:hypothetical protein